MKYIRTKTFITYLESYMTIDNDTLIIGGAKHKIIKQADTIDELINRYVIITKGSNVNYKILTKYQFGNLSRLKLIEGIKEGKIKVFGAIWADKGLIYVAKMNEEGELELL